LKDARSGRVPSTITIDGPAASGKSTIGALLADELEYIYLDTGVMYRAVTWVALETEIAIEDEAAVTALARRLRIDIHRPQPSRTRPPSRNRPPSRTRPPGATPPPNGAMPEDDGRQYTVLADGQDVTWQIRRPEVDRGVSPVSAYLGVRLALTEQQRRLGERGRVVMVGRDIGTVVMPDADLKIYLDATLEERAGRRYREILARGEPADYCQVLSSVRRRDEIDSGRAVAPLQPADDAIVVDTTLLPVEEVMTRVLALVESWGQPSEQTP
jgi:cytidylate kinase